MANPICQLARRPDSIVVENKRVYVDGAREVKKTIKKKENWY